MFAATRVRKEKANKSRLTKNVVAALFTHDTSRALDPHLHTHCIVFNTTHDSNLEQWKALQNYEMLRARKYVEAVYYHELAKDLHRFGYRIRNRARGDFEIEGVSDGLANASPSATSRLTTLKLPCCERNLNSLRQTKRICANIWRPQNALGRCAMSDAPS